MLLRTTVQPEQADTVRCLGLFSPRPARCTAACASWQGGNLFLLCRCQLYCTAVISALAVKILAGKLEPAINNARDSQQICSVCGVVGVSSLGSMDARQFTSAVSNTKRSATSAWGGECSVSSTSKLSEPVCLRGTVSPSCLELCILIDQQAFQAIRLSPEARATSQRINNQSNCGLFCSQWVPASRSLLLAPRRLLSMPILYPRVWKVVGR